eukprot:5108034-Prymnesium_polylepis.1
MTRSLVGALLASTAAAQFNWGSGCGGGQGAPFSVSLPEGQTVRHRARDSTAKYSTCPHAPCPCPCCVWRSVPKSTPCACLCARQATVGSIPPGKYAVQILLDSTKDVDVQLWDGAVPLISWCEKKPKTRASQITKACGLLPSDPDTSSEESVDYQGMRITYSGYSGVGGAPGKEFITIQGKTATTLTMKAFAFEAGSATVNYKWGRVQTGCCMGVVSCKGTFTSSVRTNAYVTIGCANQITPMAAFTIECMCARRAAARACAAPSRWARRTSRCASRPHPTSTSNFTTRRPTMPRTPRGARSSLTRTAARSRRARRAPPPAAAGSRAGRCATPARSATTTARPRRP